MYGKLRKVSDMYTVHDDKEVARCTSRGPIFILRVTLFSFICSIPNLVCLLFTSPVSGASKLTLHTLLFQ